MRRALAVLIALSTQPAFAGTCAVDASSIVLSPRDLDVPRDGGVVVGSTSIGIGGEGGAPDAMNPSWRFHDDVGGEHAPMLVPLAPGLVSYRPPEAAVGRLRLASGGVELHSVRQVTTAAELLQPPSVRRVRARGATTVTVDLTKGAPADAVAVVVIAVTKQGYVPRSWAPVSASEKSIVAYQAPGRCEPAIPGAKAAKVGEKVVIAWVDKVGRLSKLSAPLKVAK